MVEATTTSRIMADRNYHLFMLILMAVLAKTEAQGVQPADVTAFQGQQVTFNCSGSDVSWNYVEELPQAPAKIFASPNTWYTAQGNKYDIIGEYYLVVNDVQADSDAGIYQCDTNEFAASVLQAKLVVIDEISMSVSPPGQLMRGMTITISCAIRYQGPQILSSEQDPALMLTFSDGQPLPSGNTYYQPPSDGDAFQRKTLDVNYTITEATPTGKLQCSVTSLAYQSTAEEMLQIKFAPRIDRISLRVKTYNSTETITCSAEGVPRPSVTWIHISGSMRADQQFAGQGKAVLKNLESGDHTWMCTASNTEGSDNYTLTFNVFGETYEEAKGPNKVGIGVGLAIGLGVPIIIAIIVLVCILFRRRRDKTPKDKTTEPGNPPINNEHRPPRPRSDVVGNVNPNPDPDVRAKVLPEQYSSSPAKTNPDTPGYADIGAPVITAGGSRTPSMNASYESSQRDSGTEDQDRFQGPNTSV